MKFAGSKMRENKSMNKQYRYSSKYDPTILTTKTVKNIMHLFIFLVNNISQTRKNGLPEMKEYRILKRDFNHVIKTIGKRGNRTDRSKQ